MTNRIEKAAETFSKGFNCAQSVFSAYAPELGIPEEEALRISSGFGGGMARLQEVCGAVTGAFMVIGGKVGSADPAEKAKLEAYRNVRAFDKRFRELHGTILCRELLRIDLNTDEGQKQLKEENLHQTICVQCISDAMRILEEVVP